MLYDAYYKKKNTLVGPYKMCVMKSKHPDFNACHTSATINMEKNHMLPHYKEPCLEGFKRMKARSLL